MYRVLWALRKLHIPELLKIKQKNNSKSGKGYCTLQQQHEEEQAEREEEKEERKEEEEEALLTERSKEAGYKHSNLDFGPGSQCNKARSRKIQTVSFWTREEEKQALAYIWHACLSV